MAHPHTTPGAAPLEEAITLLFRLVDDAYATIDPRWRSHESLKKLSDSEVLTLALFQQLRGVESERSFLRDVQRFFVHLFPGVARTRPSSLHRRVRRLRRFWSPCAARSCPRIGRRPRDPRRRLDAFGSAPPSLFPVVGEAARRTSGTALVALAQASPAAGQTLPLPNALRATPGRDRSIEKRKGTHPA